MNQRTQEGRKTYVARFVPCPKCGLHGAIVIDGVPESADYPVPLPNQGQVQSQEKAILQAAGLLMEGYLDVDGFRALIKQILLATLSPTEELKPLWAMEMLLARVSEVGGQLSPGLREVFDGL